MSPGSASGEEEHGCFSEHLRISFSVLIWAFRYIKEVICTNSIYCPLYEKEECWLEGGVLMFRGVGLDSL